MDVLRSLNINDLPEQQTRINDAISKALQKNPDLSVGFDACCTCAKPLNHVKGYKCCKGCKRVWYCSRDCRRQDANSFSYDAGDVGGVEEHALGHSSIICSLLRQCEIDDAIENSESTTKLGTTREEENAAKDHITSEYESYPATFNVLMDAPCYQTILLRRKQRRRMESPRKSIVESVKDESVSLTIHIIGASEEAELWGNFTLQHDSCPDVYSAYSESLVELASSFELEQINLIFIGRDCPKRNVKIKRNLQTSPNNSKKRNFNESCQLIIQTFQCSYDGPSINSHKLHKPDICIFFNPGFTCPDYNWKEALGLCGNYFDSKEIAFLVTTNTEMEALSDLQYLYQNGFIDDLPTEVADIVNNVDEVDDLVSMNRNDRHDVFFGINPNSGTRIRQSGNMANDLFVKNRWIYGGFFSSSQNKECDVKGHNDNHMPQHKEGNATRRENVELM